MSKLRNSTNSSVQCYLHFILHDDAEVLLLRGVVYQRARGQVGVLVLQLAVQRCSAGAVSVNRSAHRVASLPRPHLSLLLERRGFNSYTLLRVDPEPRGNPSSDSFEGTNWIDFPLFLAEIRVSISIYLLVDCAFVLGSGEQTDVCKLSHRYFYLLYSFVGVILKREHIEHGI